LRKRDWVFVVIAGSGILAWLWWAFSTQLRWARSNKPIQVLRPEEAPQAPPASPVVGPISDETRAAMEKNFAERRKRERKP